MPLSVRQTAAEEKMYGRVSVVELYTKRTIPELAKKREYLSLREALVPEPSFHIKIGGAASERNRFSPNSPTGVYTYYIIEQGKTATIEAVGTNLTEIETKNPIEYRDYFQPIKEYFNMSSLYNADRVGSIVIKGVGRSPRGEQTDSQQLVVRRSEESTPKPEPEPEPERPQRGTEEITLFHTKSDRLSIYEEFYRHHYENTNPVINLPWELQFNVGDIRISSIKNSMNVPNDKEDEFILNLVYTTEPGRGSTATLVEEQTTSNFNGLRFDGEWKAWMDTDSLFPTPITLKITWERM